MALKILSIGDNHWGALDPYQLYKEHQIFIDYLEKNQVNILVFNGDYFNSKLSSNSDHLIKAMQVFGEVLEIASRKKIVVRAIEGTISHDVDQWKLLEEMAKLTDVDFKVFKTVTEETIFNSVKILWMPEEYNSKPNDYYAPYFEDKFKYDFIFYHGLCTDVGFVAKMQESEKTYSRAPILDTKMMIDAVKGLVVGGHVHTPMVIKDKFVYVGSFSCWCHGEEEEKGFNVFDYNPETWECDNTFIINTKRQRFETVTFKSDSKIYTINIEELIQLLLQFEKEKCRADKLRFKFYLPDNFANMKTFQDSIKQAFNAHKNVRLVFKNTQTEKEEEKVNEIISKLKERFNYIFDKVIPYENKIASFIQNELGKDITADEVSDIIYK